MAADKQAAEAAQPAASSKQQPFMECLVSSSHFITSCQQLQRRHLGQQQR
jgi:hypothetical protein